MYLNEDAFQKLSDDEKLDEENRDLLYEALNKLEKDGYDELRIHCYNKEEVEWFKRHVPPEVKVSYTWLEWTESSHGSTL